MNVCVFKDRKADWKTISESQKKCIFNGEISAIPRVGEKIQVQYMVERVKEVIYLFDYNAVEIHVDGYDNNNDFEEIKI